MKIIKLIFLALVCLTFLQCSSRDSRVANPVSSEKRPLYDLMNDIRLEISDLEATNLQLENFTALTKSYLESAPRQQYPKLLDMYHEKGLLRDKGAYKYADRFDTGGCIIRAIFYDDLEKARCLGNAGIDKKVCRQIGKYYLLSQVFTANPVSEDLEKKINAIFDKNIEKHRANLSK